MDHKESSVCPRERGLAGKRARGESFTWTAHRYRCTITTTLKTPSDNVVLFFSEKKTMLKSSHCPTITSMLLLTFVLCPLSLQWICIWFLSKASPCPSNHPSTLDPTVLTDFLHQAQHHPSPVFLSTGRFLGQQQTLHPTQLASPSPPDSSVSLHPDRGAGQQVHSLHDPAPLPPCRLVSSLTITGILLRLHGRWLRSRLCDLTHPLTRIQPCFPTPGFSPLTISLPLLILYVHECPEAASLLQAHSLPWWP